MISKIKTVQQEFASMQSPKKSVHPIFLVVTLQLIDMIMIVLHVEMFHFAPNASLVQKMMTFNQKFVQVKNVVQLSMMFKAKLKLVQLMTLGLIVAAAFQIQ